MMPVTIKADKKVSTIYSRTTPFYAKVLKNINLNGVGSSKEIRHIELSLEGSGLSYIPGDALGILPSNDPKLVSSLLEEMKWDPDTEVIINKQGDTLLLKEALTTYYEITLLTKKIVQQAAKLQKTKSYKSSY